MCGIAGKYLHTPSDKLSPHLIKNMIDRMDYRGPDESGIYIDDHIGLGHARLSIIDLTEGTQPIHNEDQTKWIVLNGEIFNYVELKIDLEKQGHQFYTTTDTEVLLHLYEEKGTECLNELNGQFAFAIWDTKKQELFLARDRVGINPLFYTNTNDAFLFASEIKAIFADPEIPREIDTSALGEIFTFWTTLPGRTVFKNIFELQPGHYLKITDRKLTFGKYWDLPYYPPEEQLTWSVDKFAECILDMLTDAVRIRLRADVPVGCYLSGGLDSSGVTSLVIKKFNNKVKTFGVRFEEKSFDEGEHQDLMTSFLKADHTEIIATNQSIGASLPDVLWHCERPLLRTGPVPMFLLSEAVHHHDYKVVLTGEGADEIFGGYNIYREAKVRNFWARQPQSEVRGKLIKKLYPYIFNDARIGDIQQRFFATGLEQYNDPFFSHLIRWQNTSKIKTFFSDDLGAMNNLNTYTRLLELNLPDSFNSRNYLAKAQYLEMSILLSNYLLSSQGERMAMAHSLEIRLPYLDHRLVDFMGRVPQHLKIRGLNEKYILKKAFQGILPDAIIKRPKQPYRAPISQSLFNGTINSQTLAFLTDNSLSNSGFFNPNKVASLIRKFQKNVMTSELDNMAIMGILSTQIIHDQFILNFYQRTTQAPEPAFIIDKRTS